MIIDCHTHFWDGSRPNKELYRRESTEAYKAVAVRRGVCGTIVIEGGNDTTLEDDQWLLDQAAMDPFILGYVGRLRPESTTFRQWLERFAKSPLMYGVRTHSLETYDVDGTSPCMDSIDALMSKDLELEVDIPRSHYENLLVMLSQLPRIRLIVNHCARAQATGKTPDSEWIDCVERIARFPNTFCKVSAFVQTCNIVPPPHKVDFYRPAFEVLWNAFGRERLIYGSNWPQLERICNYTTVQTIVMSYFEGKGTEAMERFFWSNSKVAYRWKERTRQTIPL